MLNTRKVEKWNTKENRHKRNGIPLTVWTVLTQGCIMKAQPYRRCLISITVQRADFEDWLC